MMQEILELKLGPEYSPTNLEVDQGTEVKTRVTVKSTYSDGQPRFLVVMYGTYDQSTEEFDVRGYGYRGLIIEDGINDYEVNFTAQHIGTWDVAVVVVSDYTPPSGWTKIDDKMIKEDILKVIGEVGEVINLKKFRVV